MRVVLTGCSNSTSVSYTHLLDQLADHLKVPHMDANKLGYIQHRPLQWENECTRHKLLDIIGDMAPVSYTHLIEELKKNN